MLEEEFKGWFYSRSLPKSELLEEAREAFYARLSPRAKSYVDVKCITRLSWPSTFGKLMNKYTTAIKIRVSVDGKQVRHYFYG